MTVARPFWGVTFLKKNVLIPKGLFSLFDLPLQSCCILLERQRSCEGSQRSSARHPGSCGVIVNGVDSDSSTGEEVGDAGLPGSRCLRCA